MLNDCVSRDISYDENTHDIFQQTPVSVFQINVYHKPNDFEIELRFGAIGPHRATKWDCYITSKVLKLSILANSSVHMVDTFFNIEASCYYMLSMLELRAVTDALTVQATDYDMDE